MLFWFGIIPALAWQFILAIGYLTIAPDQYSQLAYATAKLLLVLWPLIWWRRLQHSITHHQPLRKASWRGGVILSVVIICVVVITVWFLQSTVLNMTELIQQQVTAFGLTKQSYIWFALGLASLHAAFEEWYWRSFVFRGVQLKFSWRVAAVVSSSAFAAHHAVVLSQFSPWWFTLIGTVAVGMAGWAWCYLYQRTHSLLGSWLSHFVADLVVLGVGYWLLFLR